MPLPGTVNNPEGLNNWQGFTSEPPYGAITNLKRLAGAAPLAGAPLASGPIEFPRQAQRQATRPQPTPPVGVAPAPPAAEPFTTRQAWQAVNAIPGISPLAAEYLARA